VRALVKMDQVVQQIPVAELRPGPWQPRRVFDAESLQELAESIAAQGVLTPLRVVPAWNGDGYLIVAGERRWRAARMASISSVPCLVLDGGTGEEELRELAILDNLHRANLRPGEEARAVAQLERVGLTPRQMAQRLGKSAAWVSQRLAIALLPDVVLEQLDNGAITREEALALTRLLGHPDLVEACLEPSGAQLRARLGGHVPDGLGERVQAARRVLELERQRDAWIARMRADGHRVLDEPPREGDRRYVRLLPGSETSRAHQDARLACTVWAWEHGRAMRYCDNPALLREVMGTVRGMHTPEQALAEEERRLREREEARDAIIRAWLATSRSIELWELALLARERIRTLTFDNDRLLVQLGDWLGAEGDRIRRIEAARNELATASERRLLQLWFLLELANALSSTVVPWWLAPWLERLGFVDPYGAPFSLPDAPNGAE
jgi:ParB/RepB/Spo0J family partition protein